MTASRPQAAGDTGASLIEMTTTVAILGTVMAVIVAGVIAFTRLSTDTQQRMTNLEEARTVMAVVSKDLRTAMPTTLPGATTTTTFERADPTEAIFYANLRPSSPGTPTDPTLPVSATPVKVRLALTADPARAGSYRLVEEVTQPSGSGTSVTWPSANRRTRIVGTGLVNTATTGNAVFCYHNAATSAALPSETSFCAGSSTPALSAIASVRVQLQVQHSARQGVTVLTSQVWLPNVAAEDVVL